MTILHIPFWNACTAASLSRARPILASRCEIP